MVRRAQADVGLVVGASTLGPGRQVVDLDETGCAATGEQAAAVAVLDQPAGAGGHDPLLASDGDGPAVALQDGLDDAVAGEQGRERRRDRAAAVDPPGGGVGGQVHVDAVVRGALRGPDRGQRPLADLDQRVTEGRVGAPGGEQGVLGLLQRLLHQGALVGRCVDGEPEPAVRVVLRGQARRSLRPLDRVGTPCGVGCGVGDLERVPGQRPPQLGDRGVLGQLGDGLLVRHRGVAGGDRGLVEREAAGVEPLGHRGQLVVPAGHEDGLPRPRGRQPDAHRQPVLDRPEPLTDPRRRRQAPRGTGRPARRSPGSAGPPPPRRGPRARRRATSAPPAPRPHLHRTPVRTRRKTVRRT